MQTVRQAFTILKQNPLLSTISILGTAFAITMIMAIVIIWQTKYADLEPEVNRSRCLYFSAMHISSKTEEGVQNYNTPSPAFMKECIQPLSEVEACTAFVPASAALVSLTDGSNRVKVDAMQTDQGFWKVFSLQFMAGHGFGEEDRAGGTKAVVVCASVARKLFGTTDAVGQQLLLNREPARVIGVVKDVSVTAKDAYAQVWSMYPADKLEVTSVWSYGGSVHIAVLARTSDDFPAISQGIAKRIEAVNAGLGDMQIDIFRVKPAADGPDYREQFLREIAPRLDTDNIFVADAEPYTQMQAQFEVMYGDTDKVNSQTIVVLFLLGNVFLGLIGTFWVRTRRRRSEIALRLAMGSTKHQVFSLLMGEGLLLLALVTLPAMLVCYNVGVGEFTIGRTALIATWPVEWSMIRFLIGSLGAWLLIALMVMMGIWYPARQAMKIEPAEALHEE